MSLPRRLRRAAPAALCLAAATTYLACAPANSPGGGGASGDGQPSGGGGAPAAAVRPFTPYDKATGNPYFDRFLAIWNDMHNPKNGYFSPKGIPYHSVETLICEAPDYGHETTSEAYSYYIWLEALYGRITKDWSYLSEAWDNAEAYIIPNDADQPTNGAYDPSKPAQFTAEPSKIEDAPVGLQADVPVGGDPLYGELQKTYGTANVYGMHWLIDVDNWYGFGRRNDGKTSPAFINTFQRGAQETVWKAIPQPTYDNLKFGGAHGYLDLFIKDSEVAQWRYSVAPDADARAIQAVYWAKRWADESGGGAALSGVVDKAAKMGDYLRYSMFDKYFKPIGCQNIRLPWRHGARRGALPPFVVLRLGWIHPGWPGRLGVAHRVERFAPGLPEPARRLCAELRPRVPAQVTHRMGGLGAEPQAAARVLPLAPGVRGRDRGRRDQLDRQHLPGAPAGTPSFYGMPYQESPVFVDPPSNEWFGFEVWSMERVAEYYYVSADKRAETIVSKFVAWVLKNSSLTPDGGYAVPSTIKWSGKPSASWNEQSAATRIRPEGRKLQFDAPRHGARQRGGPGRQRERRQDAGLLRRAVRRQAGARLCQGDPRPYVEEVSRLEGRRDARAPQGLQSVRGQGVRPRRLVGKDARWGCDRPERDVPEPPEQVQERPGLAGHRRLHQGRRASEHHLPPLLGAVGRGHCERDVRMAVPRERWCGAERLYARGERRGCRSRVQRRGGSDLRAQRRLGSSAAAPASAASSTKDAKKPPKSK